MGLADLIGNSKQHLIPTYQPQGTGGTNGGEYQSARKKNSSKAGDSVKRTGQNVQQTHSKSSPPKRPKKGQILTQHTGLPPRETGRKAKR